MNMYAKKSEINHFLYIFIALLLPSINVINEYFVK